MRNEKIRDICEIIDIIGWIAKRRRTWNEHETRMGRTGLVKIARGNKPISKRSWKS